MQEEVLVKFSSLFAAAAIAAVCSTTLVSQTPGSGYHTVACVKIKPDKGSEFRKWAAEDAHKVAQARVDSGALSMWFLLRSVMPQGESAQCDYLAISMYPGAPPQPASLEDLQNAMKKAGLSISAQEFVDRRDSLTTLVSNNLFQTRASVGSFKKGDYFRVNYMKAGNVDDYVNFEKKVWQPLAEAMIKDGVGSGWSLNEQVMPGGTGLKFNTVTVDVFPSWDDIYKPDAQFYERFRKVHPDMELGTTFETYEKLRDQISIELYTVADLVSPAK